MKKEQDHWDNVYSKSEINQLGWYEEVPQPSLDLIEKCKLNKSAHILDIGSGTTTLINKLLELNYTNITALDISNVALETAQKRINPNEGIEVNWICDDITDPKQLKLKEVFDVWHDRTVLHFLTEEKQQKGYLNSLKGLVKKGGYVIIAVFSLEGAKKCSGLDVKNYDHKMIAALLGNEFNLLEYFSYTYIQPSGNERPYVYTLFQREK